MHAIVRSQALARGRRVRLSNPVSRGLGNYSLGERKVTLNIGPHQLLQFPITFPYPGILSFFSDFLNLSCAVSCFFVWCQFYIHISTCFLYCKEAKPAESNVISASLRSEKLATNAFVCKVFFFFCHLDLLTSIFRSLVKNQHCRSHNICHVALIGSFNKLILFMEKRFLKKLRTIEL